MRSLVLFLFLFLFLTTTLSRAADGWHVGFNLHFIAGYLKSTNSPGCPNPPTGCPSDTVAISLATAQAKIGYLAGKHVGMYREIVPIGYLAPTGMTDSTNWSKIDAIMDIFKDTNLYVLLNFGWPVPAWASPTGDGAFHWMPQSDAAFETVKNNIAGAIGSYLQHYANRGQSYHNWMAARLIVEPFNEFDAGYNIGGGNSYATPARNASLSNGVGWWQGYAGFPLLAITNSSVVSPWPGPFSNGCAPTDIPTTYGCYLSDYYANYGAGWPTFHAYVGGCPGNAASCPTPTAAQMAANAAWIVDGARPLIPSSVRSKLIYGEVGAQKKSGGGCGAAGSLALTYPGEWDLYMAAVADNASVRVNTWALAFWFVWDIGQPTCGNWGALTNSWNPTTGANNLFNWLSAH